MLMAFASRGAERRKGVLAAETAPSTELTQGARFGGRPLFWPLYFKDQAFGVRLNAPPLSALTMSALGHEPTPRSSIPMSAFAKSRHLHDFTQTVTPLGRAIVTKPLLRAKGLLLWNGYACI